MKMRATFALVLVLALTAAETESSKTGFDSERLAKCSARMQEFVDKDAMAGVVTMVARHGGTPIVKAFGYQNLEEEKPMRPDTIFQLMSMTKPVTAMGIMILADEGRLTIDDPVEKHLPEFRGMRLADKLPARPITIRDLLTHTSGMPKVPEGEFKLIYFSMDKTLAEAVTAYSKLRLEFEPGTNRQYSNTGMATAGRIIEVISGMPYEKFIEEHIFRPLGMKDSFYFPPENKKDRIAMVYRSDNGKLTRADNGPGGNPALYRKGAKYPCPECGMYSTASDLAALYQMVLNGGTYKSKRILSKASVQVMTTKQTSAEVRGNFGLGWSLAGGQAGGTPGMSPGSFSHGGALGTHAWADPVKELIGCFLTQRWGGERGPGEFKVFLGMVYEALAE